MTKNVPIKVMATPQIDHCLAEYIAAEGGNRSQAGSALMALGYRVWLHNQTADDDEVSVDKLLELLLRSSYSTFEFLSASADKKLAKQNDKHGGPYDTAPLVETAKALAAGQMEKLLTPKD